MRHALTVGERRRGRGVYEGEWEVGVLGGRDGKTIVQAQRQLCLDDPGGGGRAPTSSGWRTSLSNDARGTEDARSIMRFVYISIVAPLPRPSQTQEGVEQQLASNHPPLSLRGSSHSETLVTASRTTSSSPPAHTAKNVSGQVSKEHGHLLPELAVRDRVPSLGVVGRPVVPDTESEVDGRDQEKAVGMTEGLAQSRSASE